MYIYIYICKYVPGESPHPMVFNDSWDARAAHPTADPMQMHTNFKFFCESGAAGALPTHCPHNENAWKSTDFQ